MRLARLLIFAFAIPVVAGSLHHGDSYILRLGNTTFMSGDGMSISELKTLQSRYGKRFLWFRHDGKTYVSYDDVVLDRATALTQPQQQLGSSQGALGMKQAELGEAQAKLGREQADLGREQATRGLSDAARERLDKKQEQLSKRQEELERRQEELEVQQEKMSAKQDELSLETEKKFAALVEQLIRSGAAKEVSR
jgi:hypothetical protein